MKIALVLPRNMRFSPNGATAIDLCAHDYALASRFHGALQVFARECEAPYDDVSVTAAPRAGAADGFLAPLKAFSPDVILVEQYLPVAATLAQALPGAPVFLRRHGVSKPVANALKRFILKRKMRHLAGVVAVSQTVADTIRATGAVENGRIFTAENAIDVKSFNPVPQRDKTIAFVGRLAPEKGVLELSQACVDVLFHRNDWSATFVLSSFDAAPDYRDEVLAVLSKAADGQIKILRDAPYDEVRNVMERTAIAVVPSRCIEAFGRTALEAMAGGAALISATAGGLREVIGEGERAVAVALDDVNSRSIAAGLKRLMDRDELRADMGARGRERALSLFDLPIHAKRLDDILSGAVGEN